MTTPDPHSIHIVISTCRLSPMQVSRSNLTTTSRCKSTNRARPDKKIWSRRRLRLNKILSPTRLTKKIQDQPSTGSSSSSTQEEALTPRSRSIERGFRLFSVNKVARPGTQLAMLRARKLKLPTESASQGRSYQHLAPIQRSRSKSPAVPHRVENLVEKILTSRHKRMEVQQQIADNVSQKHEQFSQIVNEVKHTFELRTVEEDRSFRNKYNQFDKYLNSVELMRYLKSL
mmetsp:Transcript_31465/g.54556  ORF Transcript_31465/g.54556 Transcript_31465/m.54556 type:complete len:230 (+) Transcript_31465:9692-10381(+)